MVSFFEASIEQLSIHKVGNKQADEPITLSDQPLPLADEQLQQLLMQYFVQPFEKTNEIYRLAHATDDTALNEVFHFASRIFNNPDCFHECSQQLAKQLYEVAGHPRIKSGELYVCYFKLLQLEGEQPDAIGIFKSESKELAFELEERGYDFIKNEINVGEEA